MQQASFQFSDETDTKSDAMTWEPGREAAIQRLGQFVPRAGRAYASKRNYDLGPEQRSNISCLSPWIRHRLILEEEVLRETLARHSLSSAEKFVQEVFWRGYFKGWLEHRPGVWDAYRQQSARSLDWVTENSGLRGQYEAAVTGNTGIDCFDFWARELVETGYLHNHARMWFASIWVFTLKLPWELGADFFFRHLLDGDPASNTLSWRWVSGLHTVGKTYLARADNIRTYTDGRFGPTGRLATHAHPLSEDVQHKKQPLFNTLAQFEDRKTREHAAGGNSLLLVTEEDGHPETLDLPQKPTAAFALDGTALRSERADAFPVSKPVVEFAQGALDDTLKRAAGVFGVASLGNHIATDPNNWKQALIEAAGKANASTIITAFLPVGPARDALLAAKPALEDAGIEIKQIVRTYDRVTWPHADRGFFKLKEKMPAILEEIGLR